MISFRTSVGSVLPLAIRCANAASRWPSRPSAIIETRRCVAGSALPWHERLGQPVNLLLYALQSCPADCHSSTFLPPASHECLQAHATSLNDFSQPSIHQGSYLFGATVERIGRRPVSA